MSQRRSPFRTFAPLTLAVAVAACSGDEDATSEEPVVDVGDDSAMADVEDDAVEGSDANEDPVSDSDDAEPDAPEGDIADPDVVEDGGADADDTDDAQTGPPEFVRAVPSASGFPAPDGKRWARSIVHLHSTHSHDACDDVPRMEDGSFNMPCLESLREALCDTRIDVAYLTDHPTHMDEEAFIDLVLHDPETDELVLDDDERPYANWIPCDDGHRVLVRAGAEDSLMPLGLRAHVHEDQPTRHEIMNDYDAEAAAAMRSQGALVWVAHTEEKSVDDLRSIGIDGLEVYQLHANLDPGIREESLGLDPLGPVADLFPLIAGTSQVPPDLALLGFLEENKPSLATWATLLAEGPMVGTAGTDAHENTFPGEAIDGERLDSYRRMMSWFSNYLLLDGELTPESADLALSQGRNMIVFDLFGSPAGLDFYVDRGTDSAERVEMGATAAYTDGMVLRGTVPAPEGPSGLVAETEVFVFRAVDGAWEEVSSGGAGALEFPLDAAGIYRVEVRVTGAHFQPWLERFDWGSRTYPWVYTNAWRLGVDLDEG